MANNKMGRGKLRKLTKESKYSNLKSRLCFKNK